MRRPIAATLLAGSLLATPHLTPGALAAHATAESDALASASAFADALLERNGSTLDRERFPEAEAALSDARRQDPNNARWHLALGVIRMNERRAADAKPLFERAVALDANSADAHYWLATSLFSTINEASMLAKARIAGQAKDALERAVSIAPDHIPARIGLAEFYRNAPGIAGGSTRKAKEHAEALVKIPGGAVQGHRLLGAIAMADKKWQEGERHYADAINAATSDEERRQALISLGYALLMDKKDANAAIPHLRSAYELAASEPDVSTLYLYGRALAETGRCADAIPLLEQAIAINELAKNTRLTLADCYAKQGRRQDAIRQYEEFLRLYPDDDQARTARRAIRDLQKK